MYIYICIYTYVYACICILKKVRSAADPLPGQTHEVSFLRYQHGMFCELRLTGLPFGVLKDGRRRWL